MYMPAVCCADHWMYKLIVCDTDKFGYSIGVKSVNGLSKAPPPLQYRKVIVHNGSAYAREHDKLVISITVGRMTNW